jgi:hypothetical protein
MITRATKNPPPDRAAKTGATWAFCAFVANGNVEGDTGSRLPSGAIVVEGVMVGGAVGAGTVAGV